jgi:hypothetical protein
MSNRNNRDRFNSSCISLCSRIPQRQRQKLIHPVTGTVTIIWDLTFAIGYTLLRTVTITLTSILAIYFGIHCLIAVIAMSLEIAVFSRGILQVRRKNSDQMAQQTWKSSFPNMGVCFPFSKNSLPFNVRPLERFRGKGSKA